jgi:hypothetical protein
MRGIAMRWVARRRNLFSIESELGLIEAPTVLVLTKRVAGGKAPELWHQRTEEHRFQVENIVWIGNSIG